MKASEYRDMAHRISSRGRKQGPESELKAHVEKALSFLQITGKVWYRRVNSGAVKYSSGDSQRFVRYGSPGMSDFMVRIRPRNGSVGIAWYTLWLELKAPGGIQSAAQIQFEAEVRAIGDRYALCRSMTEFWDILGFYKI